MVENPVIFAHKIVFMKFDSDKINFYTILTSKNTLIIILGHILINNVSNINIK